MWVDSGPGLRGDVKAGGSVPGVVERAADGGGGPWRRGMPVETGGGLSSAQMAVQAAGLSTGWRGQSGGGPPGWLRSASEDGRLDGRRRRRGRRLLMREDWLSRTRAARRGRLRQVHVLPVPGKAAPAASVGSGGDSHVSVHACLAAVPRWPGLTAVADGAVRADGGDRRSRSSTAPGSSWLERARRKLGGEGAPAGEGARRAWPAAMTDGEGRRLDRQRRPMGA